MSDISIEQFLYGVSVWALPLLLAITLHEAGHAYAAKLLGDPTADDQGRVSLNPLKHIDPFGTIILPLMLFFTKAPFLFGWAKPVPVRFDRLKQMPRDIGLVAAAGPFANLILIIISALLFNVAALMPDGTTQDWFVSNLNHSILINVVLIVFNLLPIPPLDGSKIIASLSPAPLRNMIFRSEQYGMILLIGFLAVAYFVETRMGISILGMIFKAAIDFFHPLISPLTSLYKFI